MSDIELEINGETMPNTAVPAAGGALPTAQPTIFLAVTPSMRLRLATTIENLIPLLDEIEGDDHMLLATRSSSPVPGR